MIIFSMGLALIVQSVRQPRNDKKSAPANIYSFWVLVVSGLIGGLLTGFSGVGTDTVLFIILVLLYRVRETNATPTTVALMAITSMVGFGVNLMRGQFVGVVVEYWLAAVPVVAAGGVLGAYICTCIPALVLRYVLVALIAVEVLSTFLILPLSLNVLIVVGCVTLALSFGFVAITELSGKIDRSANSLEIKLNRLA